LGFEQGYHQVVWGGFRNVKPDQVNGPLQKQAGRFPGRIPDNSAAIGIAGFRADPRDPERGGIYPRGMNIKGMEKDWRLVELVELEPAW
jgi:hypothetical protein